MFKDYITQEVLVYLFCVIQYRNRRYNVNFQLLRHKCFLLEDIFISFGFVALLDDFISSIFDMVADIYELPEPVSRKALPLVPSIETTKTALHKK